MSTLSDRIKELTAEMPRGWQTAVARHCKISQPSVADWLSGRTKMLEGDNLLRAADFFKVTPAWLATGRGVKYAKDVDPVTQEILSVFSTMDDDMRRAFLDQARALIRLTKKD